MLWKEYYKGLVICTGDEDLGLENDHCFERFIQGDVFYMRPVLDFGEDKGGRWVRDMRFSDVKLCYVIKSIHVEESDEKMSIELKTSGVVPPGIRPGRYRLEFLGMLCSSLPDEMFEEGEVPDEEIARGKKWPEETDRKPGVSVERYQAIKVLRYQHHALAIIPPDSHQVQFPAGEYNKVVLLVGSLRVDDVLLRVPGGDCRHISDRDWCYLPDDGRVTFFSKYQAPSFVMLTKK